MHYEELKPLKLDEYVCLDNCSLQTFECKNCKKYLILNRMHKTFGKKITVPVRPSRPRQLNAMLIARKDKLAL